MQILLLQQLKIKKSKYVSENSTDYRPFFNRVQFEFLFWLLPVLEALIWATEVRLLDNPVIRKFS